MTESGENPNESESTGSPSRVEVLAFCAQEGIVSSQGFSEMLGSPRGRDGQRLHEHSGLLPFAPKALEVDSDHLNQETWQARNTVQSSEHLKEARNPLVEKVEKELFSEEGSSGVPTCDCFPPPPSVTFWAVPGRHPCQGWSPSLSPPPQLSLPAN